MKYSLNYIWEVLNIIEPDATEEEKNSMIVLERNYKALIKTIGTGQEQLLDKLQESISGLIDTERKEAFIKGVKYATHFLLDAIKE